MSAVYCILAVFLAIATFDFLLIVGAEMCRKEEEQG